ncbi:MAG: phosphate/phosphite/phosphonate ABC transporter substrate-binding protein [Candidatus Omnitrophota bacterium]
MRNKILSLCFIGFFVFSFNGCGQRDGAKMVDLSKREELKVISQDSPVIKIGLIPEQDIRKMAARYEPLAEYLSKKINMKVVLVYLDSYSDVCDKFINKQLDAAFFGSFSYALTHAKAHIEPIARPDYDGTSTYRGLVVVKKVSAIENLADMKGKRLVLVHRATYAGYLYPLVYFKRQGIDNLEEYFSKAMFVGGHDKALFALLKGDADVAIIKDLVYKRIVKENPDLEKQLIILSVSAPVPSNALCVSRDFPPDLKSMITVALLELDKDKEGKPVLEALGGATRFIATDDSEYFNLYEAIKVLGVDLRSYPYYDRPDMGFK